ncbi:MAG: molybdopterin-guanine dinucleotide biosynthesis protein B [Gammaproteobacteria bacterium]|nr:molybdopterin-guanine dinucleotide biosynthesis protein B [Gammaproteobacteria bacterium]
MKSVVVDKIASVAQHSELGHELRLSADIPCEEGVLVAVRVLNNKTRYNQLELTSGRMASVNQGDVVVGALGHRKALRGYSGHLPTNLEVGDTIQLLNIGGVLGVCDSANPDVGAPFDCQVLGTVLHFPYLGERIGVPARAGSSQLDTSAELDTHSVPVVALAGTCMDSGKTAAACAIVGRLRHRGLHVAACKATGVSLRRDILAMEDAGASDTMIFSDLGIVTTTAENGPALTRSLLSGLARLEPDVIVLELGDGLLGAYGVEAILSDESIRDALTAVILCANDPVSAWGGARILRDSFSIEPAVVTGPATDNAVGVDQIAERLSIPAINALSHGVALGDLIADLLDKREAA